MSHIFGGMQLNKNEKLKNPSVFVPQDQMVTVGSCPSTNDAITTYNKNNIYPRLDGANILHLEPGFF